jgi:hypothetical protein
LHYEAQGIALNGKGGERTRTGNQGKTGPARENSREALALCRHYQSFSQAAVRTMPIITKENFQKVYAGYMILIIFSKIFFISRFTSRGEENICSGQRYSEPAGQANPSSRV